MSRIAQRSRFSVYRQRRKMVRSLECCLQNVVEAQDSLENCWIVVVVDSETPTGFRIRHVRQASARITSRGFMNPLSLEGGSEFRSESQEGFRFLQFQCVEEGREGRTQAEPSPKWSKGWRESTRQIVSNR